MSINGTKNAMRRGGFGYQNGIMRVAVCGIPILAMGKVTIGVHRAKAASSQWVRDPAGHCSSCKKLEWQLSPAISPCADKTGTTNNGRSKK
jgi:hypothetical protein